MKIKTLSTKTLLVAFALFFAAGVGFAFAVQNSKWSSVWRGTDWISSGEVISAQQIAENFEFLYSRTLPECDQGGILLANADGTYKCGSLPTVDTYAQQGIYDALEDEIVADTGIDPSRIAYYGIFSGRSELDRVCAVLAGQKTGSESNGTYITNSTEYVNVSSPADRWTLIYKNNKWKRYAASNSGYLIVNEATCYTTYY